MSVCVCEGVSIESSASEVIGSERHEGSKVFVIDGNRVASHADEAYPLCRFYFMG